MIEIRLLGELELAAGERLLRIGGMKERALLALLALRVGEAVSRELLVEALWERPPAGAAHALAVRVSALRKTLRAAAEEELVVSRPGGYFLALPREQVDVHRFERLLAEARQASAAADAARAEELLRRALSLWRGRPLADIALEPVALGEASRLEELRLAALEEQAQVRLALGRHVEVVAELEPLVRSEPLRERPRGLLMLALYRCGRQADALDLYQRGRRLLVDELGIEPSRELKQLQQQILAHDPQLDSATREATAPTAAGSKPVPIAGAAREQRKVVTVLFCDVSDSTALGERLDPEALRVQLGRYFERMKAIVERHGGTVEKFIGDAVMAVFGVPELHEDDALRSCRAAIEMQTALPELGFAGRIGLATGEVVTGTEERLATGDPVNLAARLEQAARPGDILVAAETIELVGDVVEAEPLAPLQLKGKAKPVAGYRLLAVAATPPSRPLEAPLVGRETELQRLRAAFAQAAGDRSCQLFTILGAAGIGKSRLANEFLRHVEATVVEGRCLSYGEAITYAPVVEILSRLGTRPSQENGAAAIAALLGETQQQTSPDEIAWAFRTSLELAAESGPLVCLFEDIHWAEPALLDLVEHVADYSRGVPMLLLCLARPELHDHRPNWAGGKTNATTVLLEPLSPAESRRLLDQREVAESLREPILAVAEGVPLFLEQIRALADDAGHEDVVVPASIQALLAARLDQLDPADRVLLERAAIEGTHFHHAAVAALAPTEPDPTGRLQSLVRRELIRPAERLLADGDERYRFRHQLIRDAAYNSLPKRIRADLHRRHADWLADHGGSLVDLDELLGHHLEQACRYRRELDQPVDPELAAEARRRLTSAGRRAIVRGDDIAAAKLLRRAAALLDPGQLDLALEIDLAWELFWIGELPELSTRLAESIEQAGAAGDRLGELCLRIQQAHFAPRQAMGKAVKEQLGAQQLEALIEEALPLFEAAGDDLCLHVAWLAAYEVAVVGAGPDPARVGPNQGGALDAVDRALEHARRAGLAHREVQLLGWAAQARLHGSTPVSELVAWLDEQKANGKRVMAEGMHRAHALARLGRFDEARPILAAWSDEIAQRGGGIRAAARVAAAGEVEMLAGNAAAAAAYREEACRRWEALGALAVAATWRAMLAQSQYELGLLDQADESCRRADELDGGDDVITQMLWQQVAGKIRARRGDEHEAERLAREAVAIADGTQLLEMQADAYADLAETLELIGKHQVAREALEQAASRYRAKGHLVGLERVRARLAALDRRLLRAT